MSYSEPLINQPRVLLLSLGVGVMLCFIYVSVQGMCRLLGDGKLSYYLADGLCCVAFALISFFFMVLYTGGRVRLHLIFGEAAGFFLCYFSLGRYIYSVMLRLVAFIRGFTGILMKPFLLIFSFIRKKYNMLKVKTAVLLKKDKPDKETPEKKKKKFNLFGKIHLKNPYKSV